MKASAVPRVALALLLAFVAFVIVLSVVPLLLSPIQYVGLGTKSYINESVLGFLAAFTLVGAGVLMAPPGLRTIVGSTLFLAGAALAWFAHRGIVRDISPYYGLFQLACAFAGGALGLALIAIRRRSDSQSGSQERHLALALLIPALALVACAALAFARPQFGHLAYVYPHRDQKLPVRHLPLALAGSSPSVRALWISKSAAPELRAAALNGAVGIETDVGSGAGTYSVTELEAPARIELLERQLDAYMRLGLAREIDEGYTPGFFRRFPLPRADLRDAALFQFGPLK